MFRCKKKQSTPQTATSSHLIQFNIIHFILIYANKFNTRNRGKKRKEENYLAVWKIKKKENQIEEEEQFKYNLF